MAATALSSSARLAQSPLSSTLLDVTYMQSGPNFDDWVLQRQTVPAGLPRAGSKIIHLKKMAPSQICAAKQFTVYR